ncbi:MAG TPA: alpha-glucan family phosphorylase [Polyangia bacterium]|nr:alpha-glucan family phosphorylase [Polyangia bacterium]
MNQRPYLSRELPKALAPLATLALDLRWTWSHGADHLWRLLDARAWELTRNPWVILQEASSERLAELARDARFLADLEAVLSERERFYASAHATRAPLRAPVAYFSFEFGLGDAIPLYAGGLGVLAGDHLKTASDLGVPIVGVGLLYQEGYFRQMIDSTGRQEEVYPFNDPTELPIAPVRGAGDQWLTIEIDLPGRPLRLRAWRATVGRVMLYLLDANVVGNDPVDRSITSKLYGDGPEMRIRQEIVLGIGGYRLLDALGVAPGACHLNEGHAAFAVLERARLAMRAHGLSFAEALAATRAGNVFTTHTPVAAGFDTFAPALVARYLPDGGPYLSELGLSLEELLALGRAPGASDDEPFRPTTLALRGAGHVNAVSAAHAETSREILRPLFPRLPKHELPISHVTNGVHVPSWDSEFADTLWTEACGRDRWRGDVEGHESAIDAVSDGALWTFRGRARAAMVGKIRARAARQHARRGDVAAVVEEAARTLDPDALTLGFARRFAAYKRPNLLLSDAERLRRLLGDRRRPVQLVIAGKAHPDDRDGKALVEAWARFADAPESRARCVFLEDYDLALAQELVQGVDVWINTPRRPWEACGTSGMKVLVNGGLNLSVLDGWWAEAYEPGVGWAVGSAGGGDAEDAAALFELLEREVVPAFYDRDAEGLPRRWLAFVRASLARLTPRFSANRMMREYVARLYAPAERAVNARLADGARAGRALEQWRRRLSSAWPGIHFGGAAHEAIGAERRFTVEVFLNDVAREDICVELFADPATAGDTAERITMEAVRSLPGTANGHLFAATVATSRPASDYTPRVVPASPSAILPLELPLVAWRS